MDAQEIKTRRKKFFADAEKRKLLIEKICAAKNSNEDNTELWNELSELDGKDCEHGRHWSSDCLECDDVMKICFPEHFDIVGGNNGAH